MSKKKNSEEKVTSILKNNSKIKNSETNLELADESEKVKKVTDEVTAADTVRNIFLSLVPYVVIIFVVFLIRFFIITPVRVTGSSMDPYLKNGEILMLEKYDKNYKRFDIIVANTTHTKVIKRIIGMPGEKIKYENCKLYINDEVVDDYVKECITGDFTLEELYGYLVIPEGYYFVMGDNRKESSDSRDIRIGLISKDMIDGKAIFRITPFSRFGKLKK